MGLGFGVFNLRVGVTNPSMKMEINRFNLDLKGPDTGFWVFNLKVYIAKLVLQIETQVLSGVSYRV